LYAERHYLVKLPGVTLDAVPAALAAWGAEKDVVAVTDPDWIVHTMDTFPNDTHFGLLYGMHNTGQTIDGQAGVVDADIDAPAAWDIGTGTTNFVLGVIDTGIDYNHPDLAANMWVNPGEIAGNGIDDDGNGFIDDIYGWNFVSDTSNPYDDHYHGTHCAGTVGGVGNNSLGVAGVCWRVKMMALKFLDSSGSGAISDAVDATLYATRMRAKLTSNSWGGGGYSQAMFDAIEEAGRSNILFVAAAGNDYGNNNDTNPTYPASYTNANVIAVAATDNRDQLAGFSNIGLTSVDLGAPGVDTYSCQPGTGYQYLSGTSMATPHVAGACALAWSINPAASAAQVKQAILDGAEPIPALAGKCATGGRLNVFNAILNLGMNVAGSVPAIGEVVFSPPTDFSITFTDPYTTGTVAAADLTVNGIPADSFALTTPTVVTFSFLSTPVTTQGTQTMFMAENSVTRYRDGDGLGEWTGVFRYDVLALAVTSTVPANASTVALPLTSILFHFNEPFDPASVQASDLLLNHGLVTGVTVVDPTTLSFAVSNIIVEGTLTLTIPAGAITDVYGNPCLAYNGTLEPDFGTITFPEALKARAPAGSLIYDATKSGGITIPGDTDGFAIALDAGQTLTVIATPTTNSLQPSVELRDPSNAVIGTATASAPGQTAVIQTGPVNVAGTYTMTVSGAGGTTGTYNIQPLLNAMLEQEPNDSAPAAQNLDSSFMALAGGATRGAAIGSGSNDWFSFSAVVSNRVTVAVKGAGTVELYDAAVNLVAVGAPGQNLSRVIDHYLAPAAGTYYARVTGDAGEYAVVVTVDAAFDLEKNDDTGTAQALAGRTVALGAVGGGGGLFAVDFRDPTPTMILTLDPETGGILTSNLSPVTATTNPFGLNLAHDGEALWYNAGAFYGNNVIYKLDAATGAVITNFAASQSYAPYGLAYVNGELFVSDDYEINVYSPVSFSHQRTLIMATNFEGLAGDGANGLLYGISQADNRIYRINPATGAVLTNVPTTPVGYEQGMAVSGDELFISETLGVGVTNVITVYDSSTFAFKRRMPIAVSQIVAGLGGDGAGGGAADWFSFQAANGDNFVIETATPAGDPQLPHEFHNLLDPVVMLYGPNGSLISSNDNGAADSKNAVISHAATTNGTYRVVVFGQNKTQGEYVLRVTGATADGPAAFAVSGITPADGAFLIVTPTQLVVQFSRNVLLTSVQAGDVTVDGVPCTGFAVVNGSQIVFDLPALGEGSHSVAIAAGAILDVTGTGISAFSATFTTDVTAPTVIASSIAENDSVPAGQIVYTATFSEPLRAGNINSNVYTLVGAVTGARAASAIGYAANTLTLTFTNVPQDYFTLTLRSGDGLLEDLAGNDLSPGNYVLHFYTDVVTTNLPAPFVAQEPRGCLIYTGTATGYVGPTGDTDSFTMNLDADQTLGFTVTAGDSLLPTLALSGPGGVITNLAGAMIPSVPVTTAGVYTVTIGGDAGSTGRYTLQAVLNAAVESEHFGGVTNNTLATAQNLDTSSLVLTGAATRVAAWGIGDDPLGPDGYGYRAIGVPFEFTDISSTGTRVLAGVDDAVAELTKSQLGGFTNFNFYGTTRTNLFISSNGLITFLSGNTAFGNGDLTSVPSEPTIAAFWDDLYMTGGPNAGVYWQVIGSKLIIQWHDISFYGGVGSGTITLQVLLDQSDHTIQCNWLDLASGAAGSEGASATVGIKDNGTQGSRRLLVSYNTISPYVGTGRSLRFTTSAPAGLGDDFYAFTVGASNRVTLVGNMAGVATNIHIQLLNSNATVLATGSVRSNVNHAIVDYFVTNAATYYAKVKVPSGASYSLAVLRAATFDIETNDTYATAQSLTQAGTVLGYLPPPSGTVTNMDFYSFDLAAGDSVTAATLTPADGAGEFVNALNPALDLYGPSGSIVATNNDGAPDGRNARLVHVAGSTGKYALRVRQQAGSGEYVLTADLPDYSLPTVAITSPTNTMQFCVNQPVPVAATASDLDGLVVKVEFYTNGWKFAEDTGAPYTAEWSSAATGTFTLLARAIDDSGFTNSSAPVSVSIVNCLDPVTPSPVTNGVDYALFIGSFTSVTNMDTAVPVITGVTSNFTRFVPGRATNLNYGIKFEGYVQVPSNAVYTFYTSSDDGSRLWIASTNVVNNDGNHGNQERSGTVGLKAGRHPIRVSYYQATGGEALTVSYEGAGLSKQQIPLSALWRLLPTVTVTATDASAGEWPWDGGQFTVHRAGNTNYAVTVPYTVTGTASNGVDFTALPASVTLSGGVTSATLLVSPLADSVAEGNETVVLTLSSNANLYAVGSPGSATVTITDKPLDSWRFAKFGPDANNPTIAGDLADPEGDGIGNLLEYALHLEPLTPDAWGLPAVKEEGGYLTLTYRKSKAATDVTFAVEGRSLLSSGSWDSAGMVELSSQDMGDYWLVKVRDATPVSGANSRFMRLNVMR
jgi:subtilisin family serine protease